MGTSQYLHGIPPMQSSSHLSAYQGSSAQTPQHGQPMQQNPQTQMLLLELLRQNNMSSMTQQQNPNSSMYGSAFMGAQHLLS